MKLLFAPDSFKGSLCAMESCDILERVTARIFPGTETISVPVADGGEGTVDAPIPLTQSVLEMMKVLHHDGDGSCDHSALLKYYQKLTGEVLHH